MGFFASLLKIAQGKPVFEVPPQKPPENAVSGIPAVSQSAGASPPIAVPQQPTGPKILPQAYIERVECKHQNGHLECEASITNHSQETLELDKVELLGHVTELNLFLEPGQEHELQLYRGTPPQNTYQNQAKVFYKNVASDYFCSVHNVEFVKLPDNTYEITRVQFMSPVRDV